MPERARVRLAPPLRELERDEADRDEADRDDDVERDDPDREALERPDVERGRFADERLVESLVRARDRLVERVDRERRVVARWSRGISARTTSLTSRSISARRNFAIRSSSRRMLRASWAVSRSPTAVASVSMRV